jgi:nucleosome binding factor SPN SPT16 subunit
MNKRGILFSNILKIFYNFHTVNFLLILAVSLKKKKPLLRGEKKEKKKIKCSYLLRLKKPVNTALGI